MDIGARPPRSAHEHQRQDRRSRADPLRVRRIRPGAVRNSGGRPAAEQWSHGDRPERLAAGFIAPVRRLRGRAPELEERFEAEAWETARQGAAAAAGFDATPLAESGSPVWRAIVESAEAHDAGVVVMGSHGRTGIAYVLMGSVADAVARHTDRPVLIVHRPAG